MTLADKAEKALRIVAEAPVMVYDVETSGVDWKRNKVVGYVITLDEENNFYIPVRHGGGGNLADPDCGPLQKPDDTTKTHRFEKALAKAFKLRTEAKLVTVGHNIKFDAHMSYTHGIDIGRYLEDTQLMEALLDEFARMGLDDCAQSHGVAAKKGAELYELMASMFGGKPDRYTQMENFWRLAGDEPLAVEYAMGDGTTTKAVREAQLPKLEEQDLMAVAKLENRLIRTVFKMERKGIRVDEKRIPIVERDIKKQLDQVLSELPAEFNANSAAHVKAYLESQGVTNWPTTAPTSRFPQGQPSFAEKWLKTHEPGQRIIDVRRLTGLGSKFITPLKEEHLFNGRVHTNLNQLKGDEYGTISGRFSSNGPNLQQVPKRNKELAKIFRSLFIPDDGMDFYEGDYSQCEPRLFAHYSDCKLLVDGYSADPPRDMHAIVAEMLGVERDPTAKRMGMGIITGMQGKALAGHMNWDLRKAYEMLHAFFESFPEIQDFQNVATQTFRDEEFVFTLLGRRCRLDNPRFAYRAVSRIIQGGNADILKYKLLEADKWIEDQKNGIELLLTVHDSFEWQAPKGAKGQKASQELVRIMEDVQKPPFNLRVPFKVDMHRGPNWAVATFGPEEKKNAA